MYSTTKLSCFLVQWNPDQPSCHVSLYNPTEPCKDQPSCHVSCTIQQSHVQTNRGVMFPVQSNRAMYRPTELSCFLYNPTEPCKDQPSCHVSCTIQQSHVKTSQ